MRRHQGVLVLAIAMTACGGCEGSSSDDDVGPASTGISDSNTGGATMIATTTDGATSVASSGLDDTSTDTAGCPAFADEASPGAITIEIANLRPEGVWLPMSPDCIEPIPYVLTGPGGEEEVWRAPDCGTCEGAVQGDCPCPPPFCDEVTALYLEPGATVQYGWNGLVYLQETVPPNCPGIADCGASCGRAVLPAEGSHTVTIQAGGATGCTTEPCSCTPMDGSCTLFDPGMSFTMLMEYDAALPLPGTSSVQIAIR